MAAAKRGGNRASPRCCSSTIEDPFDELHLSDSLLDSKLRDGLQGLEIWSRLTLELAMLSG
ncbi:hypothetical protein EJB05_00793, partial [Eragrostis curvula]